MPSLTPWAELAVVPGVPWHTQKFGEKISITLALASQSRDISLETKFRLNEKNKTLEKHTEKRPAPVRLHRSSCRLPAAADTRLASFATP
jgi:hypothetical protein